MRVYLMHIEKYSFGSIIVNGKKYTRDLIIFPNKIRENWWRKEGHKLHLEDLKEVLEYKPEILVIGTGAYGIMRVPDDVIKKLTEAGIRVIVKKTKEACEAFNTLIKEGKNVVAALHLTC